MEGPSAAVSSVVSFEVAAEAYDRFMGRYSRPLADVFAEWAGVSEGQRAIDVGCGTGALTAQLVARLGPSAVSAVDPSLPFTSAMRRVFPDLDVQTAVAEQLPYPDDFFDIALAQLVVHFMTDPVTAIQEMARVTRADGIVAACVWDAAEHGPLSLFFRAALDLDPGAPGEVGLPGTAEGDLVALFDQAGLGRIEADRLVVSVTHPTFEEWWEPYTLGVALAGDYVQALSDEARAALREHCRELLPPAPFAISAAAWAVRARV